MKIVVIEDTEGQAEWLIQKLTEMAPGAEMLQIRTEYDFCQRLDEIRQPPPNLILIDMMLRWTDPVPVMPDLPEGYEGFQRAGLRCVKRLRELPETANVPIIITTVLEDVDFEEGELPPSVTLVTKEGEPGPLLDEIRARLALEPTRGA